MSRKNKYFVFVSGIGLLFLLVFFIEPGKSFLFNNSKGDCSGRSVFIYNALYQNTMNADVVFFGSSRTMNDVNDSLMNSPGKTKYLNLGYCRYGRNLDCFLIEEYCKMHHPKMIVLEVREEEGSNSHPITPFLMPVSKIMEGFYLLKPGAFADLYHKGLCNLKFIRNKIFDNKKEIIPQIKIDFGYWARNKSMESKELNEKRKADSLNFSKQKNDYEKINRDSEFYFQKLKNLCDENKTALYFLYLPSYGNLLKKPAQEKDYATYGKVLLPPDSILKDVTNFSDYGHLNSKGADLISQWLVLQFEK